MKITKEQEARILELDPKFFTKKLELGKWYKGNYGEEGVFIFFESLTSDRNIKGFGFNRDGWYDNRDNSLHYGKLDCCLDWTLATDEEVKTALYEEAKNRYNTGDLVEDLSKAKDRKCLNMESAVMQYYPSSNDMYFNGLLMYLKGTWAEIVEVDKYYKNSAYLFKVSSEGYCIQVCTYDNNVGIQRVQKDMPILLKADVATKAEFSSAYNSVNNKLINLRND